MERGPRSLSLASSGKLCRPAQGVSGPRGGLAHSRRIPAETKPELANLFIDIASELAREKKHCAPYLAALGFILSRAPLYAGPETVVLPDLVGRAYETFRIFDWAAPELAEMQALFLR